MSGLVNLNVTIDPRQERSARAMLRGIRRGYPRALGQATQRTTDTVRSRIVDAVYREIAVKKSKLYQRGNYRRPIIQRVQRVAGLVSEGLVRVGFGRIALGRFAARQLWKKGKTQGRLRSRVSYKIGRNGRRRSIRSAFLIEFKSGYRGVFKGYRARGGRRKLEAGDQLHGPSVPHVAAQRPGVRVLLAGGAAALQQRNLTERIEFLHRQMAGRV